MERKGTGKLREFNINTILKYFIQNKTATKKEIANACSMSIMTVGTILNQMVEEHTIVFDDDYLAQIKGRPTQIYKLNPDYFHLLLVIARKWNNKEYLEFIIKDALSNIIEKNAFEYHHVSANDLLELINDLCNSHPLIKEIGIGVPAIFENSRILECDIESLKGYDFKALIEERNHVHTIILNDMRCSVYGYYHAMDLKQNITMIAYPSDSGPGSASIVNGQLLKGVNNVAGEIIYLPVFNYLSKQSLDYNYAQKLNSFVSVISILNPSTIIVTGDNTSNDEVQSMIEDSKAYIPAQFLPNVFYLENYGPFYLKGLEKILIENIL